MNYFKNNLNEIPKYKDLISKAKINKNIAINNISKSACANLINSLCSNLKRRAFVLCKNEEDAVDFVKDLRKTIEQKGIRHTVSYRCEIMTTKLERAGMNLEDIMRIAILKGLDQDTINTIRLFGSSKYYEALRKIQT